MRKFLDFFVDKALGPIILVALICFAMWGAQFGNLYR
jgi:hypothetical protein